MAQLSTFRSPDRRIGLSSERYYNAPTYRLFSKYDPDQQYQDVRSLEALLSQVGVKPQKQKKGMGFLQRLGSLLTLSETGNAIYRALYEDQNPFTTYGKDVWRGIKGFATGKDEYLEEPGKKKYTYSDIAERQGVKNKFLKGAVGIAGDILLDPVTYVGFGSTASGKLGGTGITKAGVKAVGKGAEKEAAKTFGKLAVKAGAEGGEKAIKAGVKVFGQTYDDILRNIVAKSIKTGKTAVAKEVLSTPKYVAKSGIKLGGKVIPRTEWTAKAVEGVATKLAGSKVGKPISQLFWRDPIGAPAAYKELKTLRGDEVTDTLNKLVKKTAKTFKDTTPAERELIGRFLNIRRYDKSIKTIKDAVPLLTKDKQALVKSSNLKGVQHLAERADAMLAKMLKIEQGAGVKIGKLENYLPLILKNPEDVKLLASQLPQKGLKLSHRFAKRRVLDLPFKDIEKRGFEPVTDIAELVLKRGKASVEAVSNQKFLQRVGQKFGVPPMMDRQTAQRISEIGEKLTKSGKKTEMLHDIMTLPRETLKKTRFKEISPTYRKLINKGEDVVVFGPRNLVLPRKIAEDLATDSGKVISDTAVNTVLRSYDKAINVWKGSVTSWFPAFHGRNHISNIVQNMADIGLAAVSPKKATETIAIMSGKKGFLKTRYGTKVPYDEIRKAIDKHGIRGGFFGKEVESEAMKAMKTPLKTKAQQAMSKLDVGRKTGNVIEDFGRVQNFISNIARGSSYSEAAKHVKDFLFDYGNLSKFEKEVMRRLFPFYTWTRKNIELQLKLMATKPGFIANQMKAIRGLSRGIGGDDTNEERQYLPEYIAGKMGIKLGKKGGKTKYLAGFGLPFEDFAEIGEPLKKAASMSSPVLQAPSELLFDKIAFSGQKLSTDTDGKAFIKFPKSVKDFLEFREIKTKQSDGSIKTKYYVNPYKKWLLYKLPSSRFASTYSQAADPSRSGKEQLLQQLTGAKIYGVDMGSQKYYTDKDHSDYLLELLTKLGMLKEDTFLRKPEEPKTKSDKRYQYIGKGKYRKMKLSEFNKRFK